MIYEKINKVMEDVGYLLKDKKVGSGGYAYNAVTDEQVKTKVRESMIKNKVIGHVVSMSHDINTERWVDGSKQKQQVTVTLSGTYKFIDTEDGSSFETCFFGYGQDSADKADGKAMTYALKYMFINTFVIPSGDDKDRDHSNDIEKPPAKQQQPATKAPNWAGHLSNLIVKLKKQGDITDGRIAQIKKDWSTINHETLYRELLQSDSQKK